ncbi:MAG TPA: AAA family ATPase [Candidatus Mailhella merdavium]|nr:AAA family ATPase [Candidatus Mailhella merdavium]
MSIKELLSDCAPSRRKLAEELGMSPAALSQLLNHGTLPKRRWPEIREAMLSLAAARGKAESDMEAALKELEQKPESAPEETAEQEKEPMILRKQTLTMQARQTFGLVRNPFTDPETSADVFMSPDIRFARETLYQAATGSGFLALVGESGSGKSTLKDELITRINDENLPVIIIEPYTLAMAANESQGKPLRSSHIAEAIISTVQPGAKIPSSPEMRFRRLHEILKASHTAGMRHCLIIEEAHDLHRHTLKSLKRFHELKDGLARLLSIILIGQTELEKKLRVTDASVREVVQRCDVVHLSAIADPGAYLRHRFEHAGADFDATFSPDGIEEIRANLTVSPDSRGDGVYMGYPLMIANLATAALNLAASVGEKQVTADVVRMVRQ